MHSEFGTWYRIAEPMPTHERLTNRWSVVEQIAEDDEGFSDTLLLSIAHRFRLGVFDADAYKRFCEKFQEVDASFDVRGVVEQAILASAAIVCRIEDGDEETASRSALAVMCSSCNGLRNDEILERVGFLARARDALRKLATDRWPNGSESLGGLNLGLNLDDLDKQAAQGPTQPVVAQGIITALQAIKKHLDKTSEDLRRRTQRESLLAEECDMLWWLTGGHSDDRNMPYSQMKAGEAAFVAGKELADLTSLPPGPVSVPAFLQRLLAAVKGSSKSISLSDAVDACDIEWRRRVIASVDCRNADLVAPLHVAIEESTKSPTWSEAFKTRTELSATVDVIPCELASQFYVERLCLKPRISND